MIAALRRRRPGLRLSVSWTTRAARPGEVEGRHYRFVDEATFLDAVNRGEFVEHERYRGALYGTPWPEIRRDVDAGESVVVEVDVRGARSIKRAFPEAVTIFIEPPSQAALEQRLRARGTDTPDQIRARLELAAAEMRSRDDFDHKVTNEEVERAVDRIEAILDGPSPTPPAHPRSPA